MKQPSFVLAHGEYLSLELRRRAHCADLTLVALRVPLAPLRRTANALGMFLQRHAVESTEACRVDGPRARHGERDLTLRQDVVPTAVLAPDARPAQPLA